MRVHDADPSAAFADVASKPDCEGGSGALREVISHGSSAGVGKAPGGGQGGGCYGLEGGKTGEGGGEKEG